MFICLLMLMLLAAWLRYHATDVVVSEEMHLHFVCVSLLLHVKFTIHSRSPTLPASRSLILSRLSTLELEQEYASLDVSDVLLKWFKLFECEFHYHKENVNFFVQPQNRQTFTLNANSLFAPVYSLTRSLSLTNSFISFSRYRFSPCRGFGAKFL